MGFGSWCYSKRLSVSVLKPAHIAMYLMELRAEQSLETGKPLATSTLHGHMRAIKTFLFWCANAPQQYLSCDVPENIVMPKLQSKVIQPLSKQHIKELQ